jgi:hypothetical protein
MDTRDGVQQQMGHILGEAIHADLITSDVTSMLYNNTPRYVKVAEMAIYQVEI